jgi:predicted MFS family arabinose efflux permease
LEGTGRAARYRDVFANGEFRSLWLGELISIAGDQIARVALSVLVYEKTDSPALSAFTFALTFLPALLGPLLAGLADRYPRREVMIIADLARAVLMAVMALPIVPLWAMFPLLFFAQLLASPSNAARGALLADVLSGDELTVGQGLRGMGDQIAQVAGYAVGGILIIALTPYGSLAVNAVTFLLAVLLARFGIMRRPSPSSGGPRISLFASTREGARLVWSDWESRTLIAVIWMIGLPVTAEGLAVSYVAQIGVSPADAAWLLASSPLGAVVGALVVPRIAPALRVRLMAPLAAASGLPLIVLVTQPNLPVSCAMFALSGAATAYMVIAVPAFIQRTPAAARGQAVGLMQSGYNATQGICLALGGVIAGSIGASGALGVAGAAAVVLGTLLALTWQRARHREVAHGAA